jgi:hypothetical protein
VGLSPTCDRILAGKYCTSDACFNPDILAVEDGFYVTTHTGPKLISTHVPARELSKYLQSLPTRAWPRGPSILISPSDDVTDGKAVNATFEAALQICRSLGLDVQVRPGG